MRFVAFIIVVLFPFLWGKAPVQNVQPPFRTHISLNTQKGCAVRVNAWLSPSCTHCSEYFAHDIPKITAMPGFCMDLHFLPNLYLLDMPVAILIWSQGPENAYKNAEFFFKNQNEWLEKSTVKEDDPKRAKDIEEYLTKIKSDPSKNVVKIKNYLVASDPFLYVKIFALRRFSIEHLETYLPYGVTALNSTLGLSLMKDLPRKEGAVVNFSPAFTDVSGQLLPDSQLKHGILTPSAAEDLLKAAGPITAGPSVPHAAPVTVPEIPKPLAPPAPTLKKAKIAQKAEHIDSDGAQDADAELHRTLENLDNSDHHEDHDVAQPPRKKQTLSSSKGPHVLKDHPVQPYPAPSPYDDDLEEDIEIDEEADHLPDDETTKKSKELEKVLHKALQGLDTGTEEHADPIDHLVN
jgi:hypothetical protein